MGWVRKTDFKGLVRKCTKTIMMDEKIFVSGHRGMVGSAVVKKLKEKGYNNIVTKTRAELDLKNQKDVNDFFQKRKT